MKQHCSGRSTEPSVGEGCSTSHVVIPVRHQTRRRTFWTKDEEQMLAAGVKKYGPSAWTAILSDPEFTFHPNRVPIDLKDKWRVIISARRRRQLAANQPPPASMTNSQQATLSQPQKRSREPTPAPNQRPTVPLSIFQPLYSPSQLSPGLPTPLLTPRRRPSDRHHPSQNLSPILPMSSWDQRPTVDPFLFAHAAELMPEHLATGSMAWLPSSHMIPSTTIKDTLRQQMHAAVTAVSKRTSGSCNLNRPLPEPPPARPSPSPDPSESPTPLPFEHVSVDFLNVRYHPKVNNRVTLHRHAHSNRRQRSRSASASPNLQPAERKRAHSRPPSPTDSANESPAAVDDIDQLAELVNSVLHMDDRSRADTLAVLAHASSSPHLFGDGADGAGRGALPQVMRSLDALMASPDGCTQPALCVDVYVDLPTRDMYEELVEASVRFRAGAGRARQADGGQRSCYVQ